MKRGAERQLTKDGNDNDEIEEIHDPQGFHKADEATLAKRQIRALPKRSLAASRPPSLNGLLTPDAVNAEPAPHPKFGGFVGFGAPASTPNPFTFTAPAPASPSAFDTTFKPDQLPSASASSFFVAPKPSQSTSGALSSTLATSSAAEETDAGAFKYFKSLRGLNTSFLSAISAAVEKDPFCDVANLVESYKNLRTTIQSEFDGSSKTSTNSDSGAANSVSMFGVEASEKTPSLFTMPKQPAETSSQPPSSGESGSKMHGLTFPAFAPPPGSVPMQLPFTLTSKPSESTPSSSATTLEPPKSTFTFGASNAPASSSQPPTSGFPFATSSSAENTTSKLVSGSSGQETEASSTSSPPPPSIAPSFGSGSVPNFFAAAKPASVFGTSDTASKPTSAFGGSVFGSKTTVSSKPTPFNPTPPDSIDSSKVPTSLFSNAAATSSSTSANIFRVPEKAASVFGSAFQTSAFSTGKPGGSIGNPVGFGFGNLSPSVGDISTSGSSTPGFIFGAPSGKQSENLFTPPTTDKSSESTPQPEADGNEEGGEEDAAKLLPSHAHDEEGEGEEDEETMHVVKCKVYRLFKSNDKSEWKDLGIGMFRLKKHKETKVRRILTRNSNTGRILINFRIHESLKPTLAKTAVSFVGYDNSTPTSFSVRVKTEEQAKELKEALDGEIAAIQP